MCFMELTNSSEEIRRISQYPVQIRTRMLNNLLRWLHVPAIRRLFGRPIRRKLRAVIAVSGSGSIDQLVAALTFSKDPAFSREVLLYLSALPEQDVEGSEICVRLFKDALGSRSVKEGIKVCLSAINSCFAAN